MASLFLYLLLLLCSCCSISFAIDGHENNFLVSTTSLEPQDVCSISTVTPGSNGATAPLVHRYGPCAPLQSVDKPSATDILGRSRARAKHIISRGMSNGSVSIPMYLGGFVDSLDYVVTLALGTPAVPQIVLVDSGSTVSWVQCKPCNNTHSCYPQKDPLFDPSKSSTYVPIPCDSDACKKLHADGFGSGCTSNSATIANSSASIAMPMCKYVLAYGDGSNTTGVYSNEMLTLAPGVVVKSFQFGCGYDQHAPFDRYEGLIGLGGKVESLAAQTSPSGGFSYCLPPVNNRAGFLSLGERRRDNMSAFSFTPIVRDVDYLATLTGISVAGKPLNISFSVGIVVDSGTGPTYLPSPVYKALQTAFRVAMAAYPLMQNGPLDTCYNFTGHGNVRVPRVALTFRGGTTIDLDVPNGVLSGGCLAFEDTMEEQGLGVLGSVNQRTFEVLYDVAGGKVGFRPGAC